MPLIDARIDRKDPQSAIVCFAEEDATGQPIEVHFTASWGAKDASMRRLDGSLKDRRSVRLVVPPAHNGRDFDRINCVTLMRSPKEPVPTQDVGRATPDGLGGVTLLVFVPRA
jgi:hypothetical protein